MAVGGCFLLFVLLQPDASLANWVIERAHRATLRLPVPAALSERDRVEAMLNTLMFVPVGALSVVQWPRHPWANLVVYVFVMMLGVELFQGAFLPARSAQYVDVVANTLGALVGVVVVHAVRHLAANVWWESGGR